MSDAYSTLPSSNQLGCRLGWPSAADEMVHGGRKYPWYLWGGSIVLKALPVSMLTLRAGKLVSMYSVVQRHR